MRLRKIMICFLSFIFLFSTFTLPPVAKAADKPFLHPLFTDHMVMQRDTVDTLWGWTSSGEKITIEIGGKTFTGVANGSGKWQVKIGPFPKGGPYEMKVTGSKTVTVKDILFGEVWFCAGQSNMAMQLPNAGDGTAEAAKANYPNIRYFTTPYQSSSDPQTVFGYVSYWTQCTPTTVGNLTAVGYYFARKLSQELDVPVGIVCSAVGGSFIESWIGNEAYKAFLATPEAAGFQASSPNGFYNGMVAPVMPFNIKGIIWYQGESNTQFDYLYKSMLTTMISDWRKNYGIGEIPVMIVQLPGYQKVQTLPVEMAPYATIREAQLKTVQGDENNGLIVTADIGEEDIHPKNKVDVGVRAAICALGKYYGKTIEYSGPIFRSLTKEGSKIRISFDHTGSGLAAGTKVGTDPVEFSSGSAVKGFAVAGSDGKFVWADANIDDGTVLVSAASVASPVEVRYSWASNPIGNLYNKDGLPASPFKANVSNSSLPPTPTGRPTATPSGSGYTIKGYISPDFVSIQSATEQQLSGFYVEILGIGLSAMTDNNGAFEIKGIPASSLGYKLTISKNGFLTRELTNVKVTSNINISTVTSPISMWAGDIAVNGIKDNTINMTDVIQIARTFSSVKNDVKYDAGCDLNSDGAINMSDVIIAAKHFNKVSADYPEI